MPPLIAAALIVLFEALCFTTALPVLSYYTQQLGGTPVWVGVMFGLMTGPKLLSNPLWGFASDRFGRRPILILNTIGTLTGSVLWVFAPDVLTLALSRLFIGVFGGQAILAQAIAADSSKPEKRAAAMGVLGAAFAIALGFGPLIGGWMAERISYASIGWLCAALQLLSLSVISFVLTETRTDEHRTAERAASDHPPVLAGLLSQPTPNLLLISFVFTTGFSQLTSTLGLMAEQQYLYNAQHTGYVFAAFGAIAAVLQGGGVRVAVKRLGERSTAAIGLFLLAAGFGMLAVQQSVIAMWAAVLVIGAGSAFASPSIMGLLSRSTPARYQGSVLGVNQGITSLGRMTGSMLGAWIFAAAWGGQAATYFMTVGITLISAAMLLATRFPENEPAPREEADVELA
ncbi:MAG: MFS transporter [Phycisphaerae bacterium]